MKSMFKDPAGIKSQKPMDKPVDGKKSPFDFRCPQYDQRSSCFVNAGTDYGVGHRQPVGHSENPKSASAVMPMEVKTMDLYVKD